MPLWKRIQKYSTADFNRPPAISSISALHLDFSEMRDSTLFNEISREAARVIPNKKRKLSTIFDETSGTHYWFATKENESQLLLISFE